MAMATEENRVKSLALFNHGYMYTLIQGSHITDDISDAFLSPEAFRATQAVEFIAEHLRNEDEYVQVRGLLLKYIHNDITGRHRLHSAVFLQIREDWKFVAMVVDRVQLWLFFFVTTVGTVGILMDAPHIFEYVDQDKIIDLYRGK